jgi:manganese/zinc/iron transport system ATP- binding protein
MTLLYGARAEAPLLPGAPALDIQNLAVAYPNTTSLAISNISLQIEPGELVALVGANGAGKSSLLKAIVGLVAPRAGRIRVFGAQYRDCRERVAYLPQRGEIDWRFPIAVERLVLTGRYVHVGWLRRPPAEDHQRAAQALAALGLAGLSGRQIGALSGGQQQRALLARALVQDADLLLLDEPFNAVDAATRETIAATLRTLKRQGKAALVATHDLDRLAQDFDRVIELRDGTIAADWPAAAYRLQSPVQA